MPTLGRIKWLRCESRESSLRYVKREFGDRAIPAASQHVLANRPAIVAAMWRPTVAETGVARVSVGSGLG